MEAGTFPAFSLFGARVRFNRRGKTGEPAVAPENRGGLATVIYSPALMAANMLLRWPPTLPAPRTKAAAIRLAIIAYSRAVTARTSVHRLVAVRRICCMKAIPFPYL